MQICFCWDLMLITREAGGLRSLIMQAFRLYVVVILNTRY